MAFFLLGMPRDTIHGTMNIVENWGAIERVALWQNWLAPVIPRYTLPTSLIAWGFRGAMLMGFLAQIGAFVSIMRYPESQRWTWWLGPVGAHLIQLFLIIPSNSDVFFYSGVGDMVRSGLNPYAHFMSDAANSPLFPFIYWVDIGTVYGPQWVNYNAGLIALVGNNAVYSTFWQKALAGMVALLLAWTIYRFALKLSGGKEQLALASAMLVAWQPNMILETTGQVHNDVHTVLLATLGLMLVIWYGLDALRAGLVLVALSTMVKFVTLPLLGVLGILRLADRKRSDWLKTIFGRWALDGVAILSVVLLSFLPYWTGTSTLEEMLREPSRLYTHPVWRSINGIVRSVFGSDASWWWSQQTRSVLQLLSMGLSIAVVVWMGWRIWHSDRPISGNEIETTGSGTLPPWTGTVLYGWMAVFLIISFLPVNSHPWYWVWPVSAVAQVLAWEFRGNRQWSLRTTPAWIWGYLWFTAAMTIAYHTRIARY